MIEFTIVLFKTIFVAFGLTYGRDVFSDKEFEDTPCIRIQVWKLSLYLCLDTTKRFGQKAMAAAANAAQRMGGPKSLVIGKLEEQGLGPTIVGRA